MLRSMTGYGKAQAENEKYRIVVEIKTVNSKQMDLNTRLPYNFNIKEPEIRAIASRVIQRGKAYLGVTREIMGAESGRSINHKLALHYYQELKELTSQMKDHHEQHDFLQTIMRMPDVLKQDDTELDEDEWFLVKDAIDDALLKLDNYRQQEGKILEEDFIGRVHKIQDYLKQIEPHEASRLKDVREKFNKELSDFLEDKSLDENRYEQELVYYLDKLDITEEKVRLKQHCDYFLETLNSESPAGKKLNFIAQEMGREINTTGSKANHAGIQKIVVDMKDELEKIKEQLANIL
ncbi:MAG: YicC/YloC family endoribonuclease [Bacteroidota bacterium]